MNTLVKPAKSIALGKKCNQSHSPTNHCKGTKSQSVLEAYNISGNCLTSILSALIFNYNQ